ncbi:hypothetical protein EMCRGX_G016879 [Ephydatia muelleri]
MAGVRGEVTVTSKAAGGLCPNSEQGYICWARVLQAQAVTNLYLHREVPFCGEDPKNQTRGVKKEQVDDPGYYTDAAKSGFEPGSEKGQVDIMSI